MDFPKLMTRDEAMAAGSLKFFTGRPCKRGHMLPRYTSNGGCPACLYRKVAPELRHANVAVAPAFVFDNNYPKQLYAEVFKLLHHWLPDACRIIREQAGL